MKPELLEALATQLQTLGGEQGEPQISGFPDSLNPELTTWSACVKPGLALGDGELVPLQAPSLGDVVGQKDGNYVARFRALFAGLSLIAESDEEGIMASWAPLPCGSSQTYKVHQDKWGVAKFTPSIGGALVKELEFPDAALESAYSDFDKTARKEKQVPSLDPAALWKASEWLVDAFLDISVKGLDAQLKAALPFTSWEDSKDEVAIWPQLANYWLLAHWAFGNDEALAETIELSKSMAHPATTEIRSLVTADGGVIGHKRGTLTAMAPSKAMSAEAKKRKKAREKEFKTESAEVKAANKEIAADAGAEQARTLFAELVELSAKDPWSKNVYKRRLEAMQEFAEAIDERWRPVLEHHQRLAARFIEPHKLAIPGLVLGLAKLCKDYTSFREAIDGFGTGAFGLQRKHELALAVGRFISEPEALNWLVERARSWAKRIDEWDVPVSPAFEKVLLKHPLPETFELITQVLSAKSFHGGNWRICVATAIAAGELRATPCADALKAALEKGLGREDNGERDAVRKAVEQVTG